MKQALGLAWLIWWAFCSWPLRAEAQIHLSQDQFQNLGGRLGKLQSVRQTQVLSAPATVVVPPDQELIVSASAAGLVSHLHVAEGDSVVQGTLLATLKSAGLVRLQQQFLKAVNERNLARTVVQRDRKLHREGVISDRRWQASRSRYRGLNAEFRQTKKLLMIAGMSEAQVSKLAISGQLSSQLEIIAPIDGVILERSTVVGERVDLHAPLYRLANLGTVWLHIQIPQERISAVKTGAPVFVDEPSLSGRVALLGKSVNPQTQTVLARAVIEEKNAPVMVGQFVRARIMDNSIQPLFRVPSTALAQHNGRSFVFLRTESGFAIRAVRIVGKEDRDAIVNGDLELDQTIAVQGAVALKAMWVGLGERGHD